MADSISVSALAVALIGTSSGITAAVFAGRAQQRVTRLTASLDEQRAESDARLNTALDALLVSRPEGVETLTTFGEFEPLLAGLDSGDMRSGPGAARDLFFEFDPVTRPVLWRVLVIQVLLYWCYQKVVFGEGLPDPADLE